MRTKWANQVPKTTSEYIKMCVAHYYRYSRQCLMISFERGVEFEWRHSPDILVVTKDLFLIEIEVKTSLADFKNDEKKTIWKMREKGKVKMPYQFYYAIPAELEEKIKPLLRKDCGLIRIYNSYSFQPAKSVCVAKTAPVNKEAVKIKPNQYIKMIKNQTGTICGLSKKLYEKNKEHHENQK